MITLVAGGDIQDAAICSLVRDRGAVRGGDGLDAAGREPFASADAVVGAEDCCRTCWPGRLPGLLLLLLLCC